MKTIILVYSYTGKTLTLAKKKAQEQNAGLAEIEYVKRPGIFSALLKGCPAARRRKKAEIKPLSVKLSDYEKIIIMMPVWAGFPVPPMNNIIEMLPEGRQVEVIMTSGSGSTVGSAEGTKALILAKNCEVIGYTDIKS